MIIFFGQSTLSSHNSQRELILFMLYNNIISFRRVNQLLSHPKGNCISVREAHKWKDVITIIPRYINPLSKKILCIWKWMWSKYKYRSWSRRVLCINFHYRSHLCSGWSFEDSFLTSCVVVRCRSLLCETLNNLKFTLLGESVRRWRQIKWNEMKEREKEEKNSTFFRVWCVIDEWLACCLSQACAQSFIYFAEHNTESV